MSHFIGEEMWLIESNLLPQNSRVVAISNTVKKSLILKVAPAPCTNYRLSFVSIVEQETKRGI